MKRPILFCLLAIAACGGSDHTTNPDAESPPDTPGGGSVIRLNDNITQDTTFEAKNIYVIPRLKQLFVEAPATLTIEPGTVIQGEQGAVLVITRGAKIHADGTKDKPIVLTTAQPSGQKTPGFWGGLLVLGAAPVNVNVNSTPPSNEATFEAFTSAIPEGKFGGNDPHDNSGVIKYMRIEFAGFNFVAALVSYPAGFLSDTFGRRNVLLAAFVVSAVAYLGFARTTNVAVMAGLFIAYGSFQGIFRAVGKAFASDFVPERQRASAVGWYSSTIGLGALIASVGAGILWDHVGHAAAFYSGALFATAGSVALVALIPSRPSRP